MKRLLTSAAMFLCSLMTFAQSSFTGSGSGTENDPYLISNPIQLNQLRNFLNQENVYFKMMADVDLTEFLEDENPSQGWQPVGTSSAPFKGVLDGNGKIVTGFWINRTNSDNVGFFGQTNKATIKNFTLKGTDVKGKAYTGFLIGDCRQTSISDCTFEGHIYGSGWVGGCIGSMEQSTLSNISQKINVKGSGDYVGGLVGRAKGTGLITECSITCKSIEGVNYVGGICGENAGSDNHIKNSVVYSNINGDDFVGGISGQVTSDNSHNSGNVNNCGFVGSINAHSNVGGIVGCYSFIASLTNSFAVCNISASGDNIGGLVGYSESSSYTVTHSYPNPHSTIPYWTSTEYTKVSLSQNYYCGKVMGNSNVGGIIGNLVGSDILSCYANSVLKGYSNVGGICGRAEGIRNNSIKSNFAIVTSLFSIEGNIGRVFGFKTGNILIGTMGTAEENKALNRAIVINTGVSQEVNDDEQNGTGVSPTTLKLKATYVAMGWDFTDTWEIQETECYPYFKTQTAPPVIQSQVVSGATTVSGKCVSGATVTLDIDGVKQEKVFGGTTFTFNVDPLQAGHEIRVSAKIDGKEQSYFTTEVVSFLGKGTEADPYQISTAADLTQVYRKGYYKLMNDIDLTSYINQFCPTEGWQSIGRDGSETVYFDGNNHKVTGLWCNSTRDNTGLFSCFANGYIKNLTVETANGKQVKGGANTGILIGKLINGTITNCKVTGTVADGTPVGGMIGKLEGGKLIGCQADVTINVTGENSYVGGLAGEVTGDVEQSLSYGTLTATGNNSYVGGLVGLCNGGSTITNSYSNAITNSSYNAAGIVAYNYGVVDKCYADGNIFSMNYGAGIVGYNDGEGAVVKNCVAMNNKIDVTFESQSEQSGGYGMRIVGGIKNNAPAPEMNNYALKTMQVSVNDMPQKVYDDIMNGTAKTLTQLKSKATYEELGWDFNTIWKIEEGSSYPYQGEKANVVDPDNPDNPDNPDEPGTVTVTDISTFTDAIYAEEVTAQSGGEATLTICLKNAQVATAYSFDLQLPEGVSLVKESGGDYQYTLSDRHNGHGETVNYQEASGVYSFAVLSLKSKEITGNEGAIWTVKLKVADNVAEGDFAVKISNAKYSLTSGSSKVKMPETVSKLTVYKYKKGDVNNDGDVDIADAVCIVNHVVGIETPSFVAQAAEVNGDGDVDIADAVCIVNYVVGIIQSFSEVNNPPTNKKGYRNVSTDAIIAEDLTLFAGKEGELTISLKNSQATNAYSFDMVLPEGVSIVQNDDDEYVYELSERHNGHMSTLNDIGNHTYSFAILSLQSKEVSGNDGAVCTFKLKVDDTAVSGKHVVTIQNAKYSLTSGAAKVTLPEATGQLTIKKLGDVNGDGDVKEDDVDAVANHIIGQTPDNFDADAADVNGDKEINVVDIVEIVKIIESK